MQKLNQIVAVENTTKNQTENDLTATYHLIQKVEPLKGIARTYRKKNDDGDDLPPESTKVQVSAGDVIGQYTKIMTRLLDVTMTKDVANTQAKADVVVDGVTVLKDAPVTFLLTLEKRLTEAHAFVKKLPTLDAAERWTFDESQNAYATDPVETTRTKKVMRNHVKSAATDKHPAQVETYNEDEIVGYWKTVKYSGALPAKRVAVLYERVEALQKAVKFAIQAANLQQADNVAVGDKIYGYLFGV